ncbi:MAG: hypothetical protein WDO16_05525 [Bacteroidota bacterium]
MDSKLKAILNNAIAYLDQKIKEDYAELVKNKADLKNYTPGSIITQYLYMRSFFLNIRYRPLRKPLIRISGQGHKKPGQARANTCRVCWRWH